MHDIITLAQRDIVSALNADAAISTAIEGVYDQPPEQSTLPYISIGNVTAEQLPTVGRTSYRSVASLYYHETYGSKQDSLAFIGLLVSALESMTSSNLAFNIIVSDVQIEIQDTDTENNLRVTRLNLELYIDRVGA